MVMVVGNKAERLTFETLSGPLVAVRDGDFISMDLPLNDPQPLQVHQREISWRKNKLDWSYHIMLVRLETVWCAQRILGAKLFNSSEAEVNKHYK